MVAGTFLRARVQIDINVFQHGRQGRADELVVDAQSEFALEHCAAIVKPSVKRASGWIWRRLSVRPRSSRF